MSHQRDLRSPRPLTKGEHRYLCFSGMKFLELFKEDRAQEIELLKQRGWNDVDIAAYFRMADKLAKLPPPPDPPYVPEPMNSHDMVRKQRKDMAGYQCSWCGAEYGEPHTGDCDKRIR
jgi:hypothetical protein